MLWDATSRGLCGRVDHHTRRVCVRVSARDELACVCAPIECMYVVEYMYVYYCRTYIKAVRGEGG